MQTAQVIPFKFEAREVRTMLIGDQPWFVANDVGAALQYSEASAMTRHLDEDEKGLSIVQTPGGEQEMLVINESGLYSAILRSRKAEAKRFKKWVTAEVLPAIRRTGAYQDSHNRMATLVDELIGMTEVNVIKGLIRDKAKVVPIDRRRSFQQCMHNRLHTRFNVPRIELIPAPQFQAACNFVAAYALEGEWIASPEEKPVLDMCVWSSINALVVIAEQSWRVFEQYRLYHHLSGLGCPAGAELVGLLQDGSASARNIAKHGSAQLEQVREYLRQPA